MWTNLPVDMQFFISVPPPSKITKNLSDIDESELVKLFRKYLTFANENARMRKSQDNYKPFTFL